VGAYFVARRPELWFWAGDYDAGVDDLGYRELYARWIQNAAWLPMLRSHGTDTAREVWRFGEPGDPTYDAIVAALNLRYRLLPYLYSLAGWTTHDDYTMLRSLPFDFRDDPAVYDVADEFMCGPAFLVCPVHEPMVHGPGSLALGALPRTRPVYLPAGADWFDLWTGRSLRGGQVIEADAPLERIPVFVRAGSIVPMGPVRQHAEDLPGAPVELHVYSGRDASFRLYEDEGDGHGYEDGAFASIEITWDDAARSLSIGDRVGGYVGMQQEREFHVTLHDPDDALAVGGQRGGGAGPLHLRYAGDRVALRWDHPAERSLATADAVVRP
jgi:alpha-D-xyloside xylohydrolase